jgi:hypothetical protein
MRRTPQRRRFCFWPYPVASDSMALSELCRQEPGEQSLRVDQR